MSVLQYLFFPFVFFCGAFHKMNESTDTLIITLHEKKYYCISSNNSRGRLFLFLHEKGAIIRGKAIIQGRRLFQIFLTRGRAPYILFYYTKQ